MHASLKIVVALLIIALGVAVAGEASANNSGGSRLAYYFTQSSFDSGSSPGSALTIFTVTNNAGTPVNIRYTIYNGTSCASAGPFTQSLASNSTTLINVGDLAPAAAFPAGIIDLWAINTPGSGTPIRYDFLTGKSLIVDLGGGLVAATTVPAGKMFSDDRTKNDASAIASPTAPQTFAPLLISADFLPQGGVFRDRIILFSPNTTPGGVPTAATGGNAFGLSYYTFGGTQTTGTASTSCVYSNTLSGAFGGSAAAGGRAEAINVLVGKGLVGWKFSKIEVASTSVLLGELMQASVAGNQEAAAQ